MRRHAIIFKNAAIDLVTGNTSGWQQVLLNANTQTECFRKALNISEDLPGGTPFTSPFFYEYNLVSIKGSLGFHILVARQGIA
eukprot:1140788-Pelagomonas_calceolata.AAC.3